MSILSDLEDAAEAATWAEEDLDAAADAAYMALNHASRMREMCVEGVNPDVEALEAAYEVASKARMAGADTASDARYALESHLEMVAAFEAKGTDVTIWDACQATNALPEREDGPEWKTLTRWLSRWVSRDINHVVTAASRAEIVTLCGRTLDAYDWSVADVSTAKGGARMYPDCKHCARIN